MNFFKETYDEGLLKKSLLKDDAQSNKVKSVIIKRSASNSTESPNEASKKNKISAESIYSSFVAPCLPTNLTEPTTDASNKTYRFKENHWKTLVTCTLSTVLFLNILSTYFQ